MNTILRRILTILLPLFLIVSNLLGQASKMQIKFKDAKPSFYIGKHKFISIPNDGLWSIATDWENQWPSNWVHTNPSKYQQIGDWHVVTGELTLPEGKFLLRDAYRSEGNRVKCIRRFEWKGAQTLKKATLSIRWRIDGQKTKAFLPGILYYGNPSGEKNGKHKVPVYHGLAGEKAIFEEHRFPMPFASFEWEKEGEFKGAALHTKPSQAYGGHHFDQWWSLGVQSFENHSELVMLSGPVTYNGQPSVAKALQSKAMPYEDTYVQIEPGTIIEKTFYLEAYDVVRKGSGFQTPIHTSIDIFKPFYVADFPSFDEIIKDKYRYAKQRYMENKNFAGFNMYPEFRTPQIVLGWAGQSEAPIYALQVLEKRLNDKDIPSMVQKSADHICSSTFTSNGFSVIFDTETKKWEKNDPVSEGQAMNSIALAIKYGRKNPSVKTKKWELFLKKACDLHLNRINKREWNPRNTAEAFYIAPFLIASELFNKEQYKNAALKIADYYAARHLSMEEPYWGGTLDATCEDKEGAWGAFQGFMTAYEYTNEKKYLDYAKHAGDVVLSFTVVWDIPFNAGRLADHALKTRGWTNVSAQNQHLDVYGVLETPMLYKLGQYTQNEAVKRLAVCMYRSCGQMIDPFGSQGEQLQQTNFAQHGDMSNVYKLRGGYSERWTVFWITAHFLHAAAQFTEMGIDLDDIQTKR